MPKDTVDPFAGSSSIRFDILADGTAGTRRCEIGKHRRPDAYTHDWYHSAFKFEADWSETLDNGAVIHQLNYNSICAAPLFIQVDDLNDSVYALVNAGNDDYQGQDWSCEYYSGQPIGLSYSGRPAGWGGPLYIIPPGQFQKGVWNEIKFHVYWSPRVGEGLLEGWWRRKGGTWAKTLDIGPVGSGRPREFNFPTMALGDQETPLGCGASKEITLANINDTCNWAYQDKMGQYHSGNRSADGIHSMRGEFCRGSSEAAVENCLG